MYKGLSPHTPPEDDYFLVETRYVISIAWCVGIDIMARNTFKFFNKQYHLIKWYLCVLGFGRLRVYRYLCVTMYVLRFFARRFVEIFKRSYEALSSYYIAFKNYLAESTLVVKRTTCLGH